MRAEVFRASRSLCLSHDLHLITAKHPAYEIYAASIDAMQDSNPDLSNPIIPERQ